MTGAAALHDPEGGGDLCLHCRLGAAVQAVIKDSPGGEVTVAELLDALARIVGGVLATLPQPVRSQMLAAVVRTLSESAGYGLVSMREMPPSPVEQVH